MKFICPKCEEESNVEIFSDIGGYNRFIMNIELEEGRFLNSKTFGETIKAMGQLMETSAKRLGGRVDCLVERISVEGNKILVSYLITALKNKSTTK
jgi:hypothetical protein